MATAARFWEFLRRNHLNITTSRPLTYAYPAYKLRICRKNRYMTIWQPRLISQSITSVLFHSSVVARRSAADSYGPSSGMGSTPGCGTLRPRCSDVRNGVQGSAGSGVCDVQGLPRTNAANLTSTCGFETYVSNGKRRAWVPIALQWRMYPAAADGYRLCLYRVPGPAVFLLVKGNTKSTCSVQSNFHVR